MATDDLEMQPIVRSGVTAAVMDRLLEMLHSGIWLPGNQLPTEQQLMRELRVSRPAVREALTALAGMGLVEKRQGSGHFVRAVGLDQALSGGAMAFIDLRGKIVDLVETRLLLEVEVAGRVARDGTPADFRRLREYLEQVRRHADQGEPPAERDGEFHQLLARLAGNAVLESLIGFLCRLGVQLWQSLRDPADPDLAWRADEALLAVLETGDVEATRAAMREHIALMLEAARRIDGDDPPTS